MADEGHHPRRVTVDEVAAAGLERPAAERLVAELNARLATADPLLAWRRISKELLRPTQPFALHQLAHRAVFAGWDPARGPAPGWVPSAEEIAASNLGRVVGGDYRAWQRRSVADPEAHWRDMLARLGIAADVPPRRILDLSAGVEQARWLPGMKLNIARSVLERDPAALAVVEGREDGSLLRHSLGELRRDVAHMARALVAAGFGPGDAVAIDMPMSYESVVAYLAIVTVGGAVVSIADSFAPPEIATRLVIGRARAIFTQESMARSGKVLHLYERVTAAAAPPAIVLGAGRRSAAELRPGDEWWPDFVARAGEGVADPPYASCDAEAVMNVLFSSGTTGEPKAIGWTHVTPIKAAADGWAHHDIRPGDVVGWPTNLGWMMGPWLLYASLLNGAAMALYLGSPLGRDFGEFVAAAGVTMLGVVPSLVKSWRGRGSLDGVDWSKIRCFSSTGEPSAPDDMLWLMARAGYQPVIEYCGGTEIGGGFLAGTVVEPQAPATFSTPAQGSDFVLVTPTGERTTSGELALLPPMLGSSTRLLNRDHHEIYFAGMPPGPEGQLLRRHGDHVEALGGGYYRALGRVDDTMNLGGIKVSSAEIERICAAVGGIVETAAVAVPPPEGGPAELWLFAVVASGASVDPGAWKHALQSAINRGLNPLFRLHAVVLLDALPRTASNKVMRRVLRDRAAQGPAPG